SQAERISGFGSTDFRTLRTLNLPPSYLLIHRVSSGTFGVMCQLDATVPLRGIAERWQPGFADDWAPAGPIAEAGSGVCRCPAGGVGGGYGQGWRRLWAPHP